jgi:hypothetical protein
MADALRDLANAMSAKEVGQPPSEIEELAVEIAAVVEERT